jgi:hypothetical protein
MRLPAVTAPLVAPHSTQMSALRLGRTDRDLGDEARE